MNRKITFIGLILLVPNLASAQCLPVFDAYGDTTISASGTTCNVIVNYSLPTYSGCPDSYLLQTAGQASGSTFAIGTTTNTFEVIEQQVYLNEDFADNSAGWTLGTEWQIGSATPSSCGGNPDPASDNTSTSDNGVAGVVLGGCASTALHSYYYLTSPVMNTAGATNLTLEFYRWLNSDYTPYMQNIIEVYNGSTWQTIYITGGSPGVADVSWNLMTYDITAYANANMQIRWGHQIGSGGAFNRGSWNIDDVLVSSESPTGVTVSSNIMITAPSSASSAVICEGDTYSFGGQTLSATGVYTDTLVGAAPGGCDSLLILDLTVNEIDSMMMAESICNGQTFSFYGQNLTTSGMYSEVFQNANGCDSIITLSLQVNDLPMITVVSYTDEILGNDGGVDITVTGATGYTVSWSNGSTSEDLSGVAGGNYTVTVTDSTGNCSSDTTVTVNSQLGLSELTNLDVSVSPNPTNGIVHIGLMKYSDQVAIRLYTVEGQLVDTKQIQNQQSFDYEMNVNPGYYFLEISNDQHEMSRIKVLKM